MNKHGFSRRCITETETKDFKTGTLRTITNITEKEYTFYGKLKNVYSVTDVFKDFAHRHRTAF